MGDAGNGVAAGGVVQQQIIEYNGAEIVDDVDVTTSVASICNMALSHLGVGKTITNLDTDETPEGDALNVFYTTARRKLLKFPFGFNERTTDPALVEEDPTTEWGYSYRMPTGALKVSRFLSGLRKDSRDSRVDFRLVGDATGALLYTDFEDPTVESLVDVTDPSLYTPEFTLAFSLLLAVLISPRLSGLDQKFAVRAEAMYRQAIGEAMADAANNGSDQDLDGEFMDARA